ncbi:hypothetical protein TNCV_3912451 [Trichonephila clavipes]|nr:hypothetical protein TNCV_3912451 [Trichonephila clavipes]
MESRFQSLTKMSINDRTKWFSQVDSLQCVLNSIPPCITKYSSFEMLLGIKMKNSEDIIIRNLLEKESQDQLYQHHDNISKIQEYNHRTYNRKHMEAYQYKKEI